MGGSTRQVEALPLSHCIKLAPGNPIKSGNEGKVAKSLIVVQAIADHEPVGDLKSQVVNGHSYSSPRSFGQQRTGVQRGWPAAVEFGQQVLASQSRVDNIFDQDDIQSLNAAFQILNEPDFPRGLAGGVAGHRDEVDLQVQIDVTNEIRMENCSPSQGGDDQRDFSLKITRDLLAELSHTAFKLRLLDQDFSEFFRPGQHLKMITCRDGDPTDCVKLLGSRCENARMAGQSGGVMCERGIR